MCKNGIADETFPWLVFKLAGRKFAVNSGFVTTIQQLPERIEPLPDAPANIRGIFTLRGEVLPVLDLRLALGIPSMQQEQGEFMEMLEARKQDHIFWAEELRRSVETGEPFTLATDPHKCAFGKWYDHFHSEIDTVNFHLRKIDEPHQALHRAALHVMECDQDHSACKREVCLKTILQQVEEEYVPKIVGLLDEAKEVFSASVREMVIVLESGGRALGVVVDEVEAVRDLRAVEGDEGLESFGSISYVSGISRDETGNDLILLLDPENLLRILTPRPQAQAG